MFFSVLIIFIPSTKEVAFIYLGGKLADYGSNKVVYFLFLDFYILSISNRRIKHERTSEENVYVSS